MHFTPWHHCLAAYNHKFKETQEDIVYINLHYLHPEYRIYHIITNVKMYPKFNRYCVQDRAYTDLVCYSKN